MRRPATGNNYGIGEQRKQELQGSCVALGIDPSRCEALDDPDLQDNPSVWWDTAKIQGILKDYVRRWDIDAVGWPWHPYMFAASGRAG